MGLRLLLAFFISLFLVSRLPGVWKAYMVLQKKKNVEYELPFATRYLASLIGLGVPIESAIERVSECNFGELSEAIKDAFGKYQRGMPLGRAMADSTSKLKSKPLDEFVSVVTGILRAGSGKKTTESLRVLAEKFANNSENAYLTFSSRSQVILTAHVAVTALLPAGLLFVAGISESLSQSILTKNQISLLFLVLFPSVSVADQIVQKVIRPC